MMRCEKCGGHALAGLAHLHGNPCKPLCVTCTAKVLEQRELEARQKLSEERVRSVKTSTMREFINRALPEAA